MKRSELARRAFARRLCRVLPVLLLLAVLLFALPACGGEQGAKIEPADESEAIAAAERLIGEAETWIRLFYTKGGMPFAQDGMTEGVYREVDGKEMENLGFRRLSDVRDYERRIFSPKMCAAQDAALFSGGNWNAALIENTKRDYSTGAAETVFVCFLADPDALPWPVNDEATFDFSRATVIGNRGDRVKITVPVEGRGEFAGKTTEKILDLCKIEGEWYLDNYPNVRFPAEGN